MWTIVYGLLKVEPMKAKQQRQRGAPYTEQEAQAFQELFDLRESLHGAAARDYLDRYIQLKGQAFKLKRLGFKVRISLPDFPRRPLLIIEK